MISNGGESILAIQDLHKSFGKLEVLKGISSAVRESEVVVLIGPSGCGKSTLLRCINRLEAPTSGTIRFRDEEISGPAADLNRVRREIGMVFQRFNLFPHLTALENVVEAPIHVLGIPDHEAIATGEELLARVGLADKRDVYPGKLSGGQQQRVAIARALAMDPALMLFDEATSALDPEMIGGVLEVMEDLSREGMTMIVVTHEMGFARRAADRIAMMDEGRIIEEAPPERLFTAPAQERTRDFLSMIL